MEKVDTLVVDKTGTLTEGKPKLTTVIAIPVHSEADVLRISASLERGSEHPLASAVVAGAKDRKVEILSVEHFESITGKGIRGVVEGRQAAFGNERLLADIEVTADSLADHATELRGRGETVMFLCVDGKLAGLIGVSDPVKESTSEAIRLLREEGLRIVMLTGDSRGTAAAVGRKLGIDEIEAEVLPDGKAAVVKRLQEQGRIVAMAGDGVNDAPALAQAQVGIAMGTGTDVAIHSAGITLVKGDLRGIVKARRLSHGVMKNIRQNLFLAFIYNALGIPVAAGILYPVLRPIAKPHDRRRSDEPEFRLRDRQRSSVATTQDISRTAHANSECEREQLSRDVTCLPFFLEAVARYGI